MGTGGGAAVYDMTAQEIYDNDAMGYLAVAGYEIRKGLYLEAGYGHVETELDMPGASDQYSNVYYIQSTIFLAPGVFLTPEIGHAEFKNNDDPEITYYGMKWQINF